MKWPYFTTVSRYWPWKPMHCYALGKVALDPAYSEAARTFAGSEHPLLDLGCGAGLLAVYLRASGHRAPILGFDLDQRKIGIAQEILGKENASFQVGDALHFSDHSGDVVMLDVLHYLSDEDQQSVLQKIAASIAPGGIALVRVTLNEPNWRFAITQWEERMIHSSGWIKIHGGNFPTREEIEGPFLSVGLEVTLRPLWGITPFNSYLLTARRKEIT